MRYHGWSCLVLLAASLAWDYAPHPDLGLFLMYVRHEGERYDWSNPRVPVVVKDGRLVTEINCLALPFVDAGPWYAVMTAMSHTGERSGPSNEIRFWWDAHDGCLTSSPRRPPVVVIPQPLPIPHPPTPSEPDRPPSSGFPPPIVWVPRAYPPLPKASVGSSPLLSESPLWRGAR